MSILASLANAYTRNYARGDLPPFGYARVEVGFCIVLRLDGTVAFDPIDLRKRPKMGLPSPLTQRTSGIKPNYLWDKTAYSLGITSDPKKRTSLEHKVFIDFHREILQDYSDDGFSAFLSFLNNWSSENFLNLGWNKELIDSNIIFALESEYRERFLHERPAGIALWADLMVRDPALETTCLVLGTKNRIADSHPPIKGVAKAQSSGAFIVSFNDDAYQSYGHKSGDNAPVSEGAAFAYTTALNRFLERDSGHRLQIGDASTVFWADASEMAEDAEAMFAAWIDDQALNQEEATTQDLRDKLNRLRSGEMLEAIAPELATGVRFYVLGLAPNAARLSIRFFYEGDFRELAENYQNYVQDMRIEPPPRGAYPPLWRYLLETAVLGKRENVAPNLAGEWFRAILTGTNYPLTLLVSVLTRIRADGEINAERAAILKAVLIRNFKSKEAPVALDPDNKNRGYLLGRLFAVYEQIQSAALGTKVNSSIKDKFYGSASAQPRKVFRTLDSGSANHLSKVGKLKPGYKVVLEKQITAIMDMMLPGDDPFPASLPSQDQALFGLGYYHQRSEFFKKVTSTAGESDQ